jgi:hypothetical protein
MHHATAGRRHDIIVTRKAFNEIAVAGVGEVFEPSIGHRLAAAGLLHREIDIQSQVLQQFERSNGYLGIELIYIARNKQSNTHLLITDY